MNRLFFILLVIMALAAVSYANDAPHANDVVCDYCHSTAGIGLTQSPSWGEAYTPPNLEDSSMNLLCLGCHNTAPGNLAPNSAIQVRTHTSRATGTEYGEGKTFIGSAVAGGTTYAVPISGVSVGQWVTALRIKATGDTSAFSANLQVQ